MKVLFFSPHAAFWVHAFPELLIAKTLLKAGHEIVYITCGKTFENNCVVLSGTPFNAPLEEKNKFCKVCTKNASMLRASFGLAGQDLKAYITFDIIQQVDGIIEEFTQEDIYKFRIQGLPLAKYALYMVALKYKLLDVSLNETQWKEFLTEFRYVLYTWFGGIKIFEEHNPDCVISYNNLYPVNRTISQLADNKGISHYFLHAGGNLENRLETMLLGQGNVYDFIDRLLDKWPEFKNIPCTPQQLAKVTDNQLIKISGESVFVYSTGIGANLETNIREKYSVGADQKLLLATMSSYDERMSAEMIESRRPTSSELFPTQIDWINWLIEFISLRPELFLIIRVHPRDFPNRRENVLSQQGELLLKKFKDLPNNVAVNWSTDKISLYKFATEVDVVLNGWSTAGEEMGLLGIPVVLYSNNNTNYPSALHRIGLTIKEYENCINDAITQGWSLDLCKQSYRWKVLELERSVIYLGDQYKMKDKRNLLTKIWGRIASAIDPLLQQKINLRNAHKNLNASKEIVSVIEKNLPSILDSGEPRIMKAGAENIEKAALLKELKRIANAIFTNDPKRYSNQLYRNLTQNSKRL